MAREHILIVDRDPAIVGIASAVLGREGYRVFAAADNDQARTALRTNHVDLMLASAELAGAYGAQVAAAELVKPVDPIELPQLVRALLDAAHAEAGPQPPALLAGPAADEFRRSFIADGARHSRAMLKGLGPGFDAVRAHRTAQEWSRTAHTMGLDEVAEQARSAAQALQHHPGQGPKLQGPLASLINAFDRAMESGEMPLSDRTARKLQGAHIALIGFPPGEADRLCDALARGGALVRLFGADEPVHSEVARDCALCLVHVRPETLDSPWIRPSQSPLARVVLVGRIEHLLAIDSAAQTGAREVLVSGSRPEEVWLRLARTLAVREPIERRQAVSPEAPRGPIRKSSEVLVVDDDPNVRALVRATLENHGIHCRVAATAQEGIALAREYAPAAALVDVNMPGMSGFEAVPLIRAESPETKVVMLTAREQEADILQGFELGSDDYVTKPFIPKELVARIRRLL